MVSKLKAELVEKDKEIEENEKASESKLEVLKREKDVMEQAYNTLKQQAADAQKTHGSENAVLIAEKAQSEEMVSKLKAELVEKDKVVVFKNAALDKLRLELLQHDDHCRNILENGAKDRGQMFTRMEEDLGMKATEIMELKSRLKEELEQKNELEDSLVKLQQTVSRLENDNEGLKDNCEREARALEKARRDYEAKDEAYIRMSNEKDSCDILLQQATVDINSLREDLQITHNSKEQEITNLKDDISNLKAFLTDVENEFLEVHNENQAIRTDYAKLMKLVQEKDARICNLLKRLESNSPMSRQYDVVGPQKKALTIDTTFVSRVEESNGSKKTYNSPHDGASVSGEVESPIISSRSNKSTNMTIDGNTSGVLKGKTFGPIKSCDVIHSMDRSHSFQTGFNSDDETTPVKQRRRQWLQSYIQTPPAMRTVRTPNSSVFQQWNGLNRANNFSGLKTTHISLWGNQSKMKMQTPISIRNVKDRYIRFRYIVLLLVTIAAVSLYTQMQHPNGHFQSLEQSSEHSSFPLMIENVATSSTNEMTTDSFSGSSITNGNGFINGWFSKRPITSHLTPRHFLITLDAEESDNERDIANKLYYELSKMKRPSGKMKTNVMDNVRTNFFSVIQNVKRNIKKTQQVVKDVIEFVEEIGREEGFASVNSMSGSDEVAQR